MRRNYVSWQIYLILLPLNILGTVINLAPPNLKAGELIEWTTLAVVAHLSMAPFVWFIYKIRPRLTSDKYEIFAMMLAGAFRGFVINVMVGALDLHQSASALSRILNSSFTIPLFGIIFYYIFESRNDFERKFRELFSQALIREMELKSSEGESGTSALLASARAKIDEVFKPLRDEIEKILAGERRIDMLSDIATGIRGMLEKSLRPLSHELWFSKELEPPVFNHRQLIRFAALDTKLEADRVALLLLPFVFLGTWTKYGISEAVIRNFTTLIFIALLHQIYIYILRNRFLSIRKLNSIALTLYALLPGFLPVTIFSHYLTTSATFGPVLLSDLMFSAFIVVYNLILQTTNAREQVLDLLRDQIERGNIVKYAQSFAAIQNQLDFATYLHGEVQSELLATSLSLQKASSEGDLHAATNSLERAATLLRRDHSSHDFFKPISPEKKLRSISESWSGIANVSYDFRAAEGLRETVCSYAVQACEEIVANAVRHAGASEVDIIFSVVGDVLQVSVTDNGKLSPGNAKGMGSSLLDKLTLNWSINNLNPGHLVVFEISLT